MNKGKYVFAQLVSIVPKYQFKCCVDKYKGHHKVQDFSCWNQFLYMVFGQLTYRESLHDIVNCLSAHSHKLYHVGIKKLVVVSTLSRANANRDWQIWFDLAEHLLSIAQELYIKNPAFDLEISNPIFALDSSVIDLCLNVFKWANFRKNKGAIKLHLLFDVKASLPIFWLITPAKTHDVKVLDELEFQIGAIYLMDKGYYDFNRLYRIHTELAFFIIRAKRNISFLRVYSRKSDRTQGLICDQVIKLTGVKTKNLYPEKLRRIKFYDNESQKTYVFLTNNFEIDALNIAKLYKYRWQIELFFKWIKQHLKVKRFWGQSENAVKTQICIALCTYLIVAIEKHNSQSNLSLYEILQILSLSPFDKTPVNQLLMK